MASAPIKPVEAVTQAGLDALLTRLAAEGRVLVEQEVDKLGGQFRVPEATPLTALIPAGALRDAYPPIA